MCTQNSPITTLTSFLLYHQIKVWFNIELVITNKITLGIKKKQKITLNLVNCKKILTKKNSIQKYHILYWN